MRATTTSSATATASPVRPLAPDAAIASLQTDDQAVARWAAFFESLPADEREGLDALGREIGARLASR